jgi:putative heme iron utilization protein
MTNQEHGRGAAPSLVFTPDGVAAPSHAERARTLLADHSLGSLATLTVEPAGYPYASMVTFALESGDPVFLISRLAEHTRNVLADSRASLLVYEREQQDPLANARVTLLGRIVRLPRPADAARAAYLAAHPGSAYYADFSDFDLYRLQVESVRYIGGYGRMSWVGASDFKSALPDPLAAAVSGILSHMNADHADALVAYARAFTSAPDASGAIMTAIDRHGFEMTVTTPRGVGPARIAFAKPLTDAAQARAALVELVRVARAELPLPPT